MAKKRITKRHAAVLDDLAKQQAKGVDPTTILMIISGIVSLLKFLGVDVSDIIDALTKRGLPVPDDI